jgi:MFS family permease
MNASNKAGDGYPSPVYAWYVVVVLFLAYTVAYIDRQIMALLIEPIKRDLGISDTQISLLHGFAFVLFYTVTGIPLGRLADRKTRRTLIAAGIFAWSIMTAICGLAKNFWSLFLARVGVGVGEACLSPAAYSMIADYFPKEKRGMAISFYAMGIFVGAGLAYIVGGVVIQIAAQIKEISLPLIGSVRPWQLTFFIVGVPGLCIVALMATVKEPARRDVLLAENGTQNHLSVRDSSVFFLSHWKTYGTLFFGFAFEATLSYGYFAWTPSMYIRTYGWTASEIGFAFGSIVAVLGTAGVLTGGLFADKLVAKGKPHGYIMISMISVIGALAFGVPSVMMPNAAMALALLSPTIFCLGIHVGLAPAAVNYITPNQLRGQAVAIYIFVVALTGMSLGPTTVAVTTDYVFADPLALRYSMAIFTVIFALTACMLLWIGLQPYRRSVKTILAHDAISTAGRR